MELVTFRYFATNLLQTSTMKKQLHVFLMTIFLAVAGVAFGQQEIGTKQPFTGTHPELNIHSPVKSVACGVDTLVYPYLKELTFAAPTDSFFVDAMVGNVRTASQAYHIDEPLRIHGVQFWGGAYSVSAAPQTLPVRAYLYSVDAANKPVAVLDSADVIITQVYDFYEAVFTTPYTYNTNFAVGVKCIPNDTLAVISNNAGNSWTANYGESLAWRRFGSGTWNSTLAFFGQDLEYMIFPIVSYDLTADFTVDSVNHCTNEASTFTNTSSSFFSNRMVNLHAFDEYWGFAAADSSFTWSYDGVEENETDGSYIFTTTGEQVISLTGEVTGYFMSCSDTYTDTITLHEVPVALTSVTGALDLCEGGTIMVDASPADGVDYQWLMDDAAVADSTNGSFVITEAGAYAVITANVCGADTSATITVASITVPSAGVNVSGPLQFCEDETVTFDAVTTTGVAYEWLMDGETIIDETTSSLEVSENGNYELIVSNVCGADTSIVYTAIVDEPLDLYLNIAGELQFCAGSMVTLSVEIDTNATFIWYQDGLEIEDATSDELTVTEGGEYMLVGENTCGSDSTEAVTVIVNPLPPVPVITASGDLLIASPAGGIHQWFLDNAQMPGEDNDTLQVTENGTYIVSVTDANGCTSTSADFEVDYVALPELSGESISLFPNPSAGKFTIQVNNYRGLLEILTTDGKLVYAETAEEHSQIPIDLSEQGSACYFIRLSTVESTEVIRALVTGN